jgi:hypothetical protein
VIAGGFNKHIEGGEYLGVGYDVIGGGSNNFLGGMDNRGGSTIARP